MRDRSCRRIVCRTDVETLQKTVPLLCGGWKAPLMFVANLLICDSDIEAAGVDTGDLSRVDVECRADP